MITSQEIELYIEKHTNHMVDMVPVEKVKQLVRMMTKKTNEFADPKDLQEFTWSRFVIQMKTYKVGERINSKQLMIDMKFFSHNYSTYRTYKSNLVKKGYIKNEDGETVILKEIPLDVKSQSYYGKIKQEESRLKEEINR